MKEKILPPVKLSRVKQQIMVFDLWTLISNGKTNDAIAMLETSPWLMRERASNEVIDREGLPFLHAVLALRKPELAAYGIAHGAPLEDRCWLGNTALAALLQAKDSKQGKISTKFPSLFEALLAAGARCDSVNDVGDPLWRHALCHSINVWETLIQRGAPVDCIRPDGLSGLAWLASQPNHQDKAMLLVRSGADVGLMDPKTIVNSPMIRALEDGNPEMADFWLGNGITVHQKDHLNRGFLHFFNKAPTVKWLIEHGIDLEHQDAMGATPLLQAVRSIIDKDYRNNEGAVEQNAMTMILAGADPNTCDHQETSMSARELIVSNKKLMPELHNMLLAFTAREVATKTIAQMGLGTPSP